MSFTVDIQVLDIEQVERKVRSLLSAIDSKDVEDVMLKGAKIIQRDVKSRIKKGPTGRLKKAVVAKKSRGGGDMFRSAYAAVDRRKKASHAHLYEYGTASRKHASGKSTGTMPANPVFWPAVADNKGQVEREINNGLAKLVGRAVR